MRVTSSFVVKQLFEPLHFYFSVHNLSHFHVFCTHFHKGQRRSFDGIMILCVVLMIAQWLNEMQLNCFLSCIVVLVVLVVLHQNKFAAQEQRDAEAQKREVADARLDRLDSGCFCFKFCLVLPPSRSRTDSHNQAYRLEHASYWSQVWWS